MKHIIRISRVILVILSIFFIHSCKKDKPTPPVISTTAVTAISYTTATSGGDVTNEGGASVTARGVCWSTSKNPTIVDSKSADGTGIGIFTSAITGLTLGTTYYVRSYATNRLGTSYGAQVSFTTLSLPDNTTAIFKQLFVGNRNNSQSSGSWWGENVTKVAYRDNKAFTFVFDKDLSPKTAFLYEKTDNNDWIEGQSFIFSRSPNIIIDLNGYVHVIGLEPFNYTTDPKSGRIIDVKFKNPNTVLGDYIKSYLTEDYRSVGISLSTFSSLWCGAAIGRNGNILVAYTNSLLENNPNNHSIGARIYDGNIWTYETVASGLVSRFAYPFAFVSDSYYHVYAIEDDYDTYYTTAGLPYNTYCFRYGMVKHFQRPITGGPWAETTLLDFNTTKSKKEIWDAALRIVDFHVDYSGTIHALLRYNTASKPMCYHYWKKESDSSWNNEIILESESKMTGLHWAKIWERNDHKLFYILYFWGGQISLSPLNTSSLYTISELEGDYKYDPTPFISSFRSGTQLGTNLYIVVYPGSNEIKAISLDIITSGL